jgi:hypothetical protein
MMKRLFMAVMALLVVATVAAQKKGPALTYVDASTLTIINKIHDGGKPFSRLEVERYSSLTKGARKTFQQSTGLAIVFRTNSRNIYACWSVEPRKFVANCNDIHSRGLDIYIRHEGKWTFAGVGRPTPHPDALDFESPLVRRMGEGVKECMVYLPAYAIVNSLEIGVDEGATIEALPSPFKHKIVFIGSSLTHGEANPRPSAIYVAQLGRRLNMETPNLGHSGQCKLQQHFVDIVCDNKADAFVFDAFSNSTAEIINQLAQFEGQVIVQTMFLRGEYNGENFDNTTEEHLEAWLKAIEHIAPKQVMVYTIARDTPCKTLQAVSSDELEQIAARVRALGIEC